MTTSPGSWKGDDLLLLVYVQPGARQSGFAGQHGDALKLRVQAPPLDGRANQEVRTFLARAFAVPVARVVLLAGETSRHKRFCVIEPQALPEEIVSLLPRKP